MIQKRGNSIGKFYRIGELAKKTGLSKRTIDYYTNLGILHPLRSESNYRLYPEETITQIELVQQCKDNKMTLNEIKTTMDIGQSADIIYLTEDLVSNFKQIETEIIEIKNYYNNMTAEQQDWLKQKINHQTVSLLQAITILLS
ncbi:MerR family transcriptional regulator [Pseudalkalibacillus sp. A8]|uniref:MerR family transcriptional regulator n=1 Tax=Pseudalkalibacillus sp. A8 TaxID=3382641 RepID=UPI0038B4FD8F